MKATRRYRVQARTEPGLLRFDVVRRNDAASDFVVYLLFKDEASLAAHEYAAYTHGWLDAIDGLVERVFVRRPISTALLDDLPARPTLPRGPVIESAIEWPSTRGEASRWQHRTADGAAGPPELPLPRLARRTRKARARGRKTWLHARGTAAPPARGLSHDHGPPRRAPWTRTVSFQSERRTALRRDRSRAASRLTRAGPSLSVAGLLVGLRSRRG